MLCDGLHPHFGTTPIAQLVDLGDLALPNTSLVAMRAALAEGPVLVLLAEDAPADLLAAEEQAPAGPRYEKPAPVAGRLVRLRERLARSNSMLGKGLLTLLSRERIDQDVWDEIEETLLLADLGSEPSQRLVEALQTRVRVEGTEDPAHVKAMLREELLKLVDPTMDEEAKKNAVMGVVNGLVKAYCAAKAAS